MNVGPLAVLIFLATIAVIGHGFAGWRQNRAHTSTIARFIAELSILEMCLGFVGLIAGAFMVL